MSVIFYHRVRIRRRHFLTSALIPFLCILFLGIGALIVTFVAGALQAMGQESIEVLGRTRSLVGFSGFLLYVIGVAGEIIVLTSIYMVMPVGRPTWRHALIGGVTAGLLWEATRHVLVWYFSTLSQVKIVYGSLTTAIVVLLSLEIAALVLLLGAQVIAEYERSVPGRVRGAAEPLRTDWVRHAHRDYELSRRPQIPGDPHARSMTIGMCLICAVALAVPAAAQTPPAASTTARAVVASTKLPMVGDTPVHFKAVSVTIPAGASSSVSSANGIALPALGLDRGFDRWRGQDVEPG